MKNTILFLFVLSITSCQHPDLRMEEKAIREILKVEQQAHLEENVDLFLSNGSSDYIAVNRGVVSRPTLGESRARFKRYFENVEFIKWEDVADPIIRFSNDASLAYVIIQKQVIVTLAEDINKKPDTTDFAWISIMRKTDGKWKGECNVSTRKGE